jgi:hypothetical protein
LARKFLPSPGQQQMLLASRLNFFTAPFDKGGFGGIYQGLPMQCPLSLVGHYRSLEFGACSLVLIFPDSRTNPG